jgi:hypothetical protein
MPDEAKEAVEKGERSLFEKQNIYYAGVEVLLAASKPDSNAMR